MPEPVSLRQLETTELSWECIDCNRACLAVRDESRCLCGHRLREHKWPEKNANGGADQARPPPCSRSGCRCRAFFFIVAEGSWMLRCRCKHKAVEHDPVSLRCNRPKCTTCPPGGFESPWVCNCDHPWSRHTLKVRQKKRIMLVMEKDGDSDGTGAKTVDFWDPVQSLGATAAETSVNSIARGRRAPLISKPTN